MGEKSVVCTGDAPRDKTAPLVGVVVFIKALRCLDQMRLLHSPLYFVTNIQNVADTVNKGWFTKMARKNFKVKNKYPEMWEKVDSILNTIDDYQMVWIRSSHKNVDWLKKTTLRPH
ncbi:hypothetical protein [Levilactobacillus namurensis]|uniref:hypothetical protein n=1 Tax=Levilactobacillus namurensis TaxID=380393 RepID=UPI00222F455A|nr:hypothetical protein [Levilactobacillus namurensis]MCW3778527.1 hypothetical protein [Levilactobacillus namurensis]MDT7019552.1 hypothetical protein [Levilactobacillus namurensis]WNN65859.1 hypothetical protein RIN67_01840 [Levilactobacillus namurensis]